MARRLPCLAAAAASLLVGAWATCSELQCDVGSAAVKDAEQHRDSALPLIQKRADNLHKASRNQSVQDDVASKQETGRNHKRTLAIIKPFPDINLSNGQKLKFRSAVPVFGASESFIALIHDKSLRLFKRMQKHTLYCSTTDGKHPVPMTMRGHEHEKDLRMKYGGRSRSQDLLPTGTMIVWRCEWPAERKNESCHDVVVSEEDAEKPLATLQACHNTDVYREKKYNMVACRSNVWTSKGKESESGVLQLPQWVEYMLMHGVDQIFFYTLSNTSWAYKAAIQPYLDSGLGQEIHLDTSVDPDHSIATKLSILRQDGYISQQLQVNDCIYRAKYRTTWLSPSLDVDEYLRPTNIYESSLGNYDLPKMLSDYAQGEETIHPLAGKVCCLEFHGIIFRHPQDPFSQLQLESHFRGKKQEEEESMGFGARYPKYLLRPELVHASFIHWPTSWEEGYRSVPTQNFLYHHYRTSDESKTRRADHTLVDQAAEVRRRIEERFSMSWPELAQQLKVANEDDNDHTLLPRLPKAV